MRSGLASRPLWRMPPQLRQSRSARLPARLVSRTLRPLPRQRYIRFHYQTILHHQRRIERSAVFASSLSRLRGRAGVGVPPHTPLVVWTDFPHPPRSTSASTSPASGRGAPTTTGARCLTGKSPISCPARQQKIFRFRRRANQRYQLAPSRLTGGAYAQSSRNARRDAMDAAARETSAPMRTAKSCGPDAPTLASSS